MEEFNSPGTWICWEIYYAGCDLHQPRLLSRAILWECQNATPHCSIHIKSVLFASHSLEKPKASYSVEKIVNMSIVQQILEYGKQIFCSYFRERFPGVPRRWIRPVSVSQNSLKNLFKCLDMVKDTVKYSLPKHIFTSVLRPWVVLQKLICLSAVINNSSVLLWFSTHQRALPSKAAVPGSRCWHWKQNIQMPISQLSERRWE